MTIKEAIEQLTKAAKIVGENEELAVMRANFGENDYFVPSYTVIGDFEDQDGEKYRCAMIADRGGEEFTKVGVPHYKWNPKEDILK